MKVCPTILLYCLTCFPLFGQFTDTTIFYLNHSSTGNFNKTNDGASYVWNNALKFNIAKKNLVLSTTNNYIYGEQLNIVSNNDFTSFVDLSLNKKRSKLYYWAMSNYNKSYSLKIDHRLQGGLGVGYTMVDNKALFLNVSEGLLYEYSDSYDVEAYDVLRNSIRLKVLFTLKSFITFESVNFFQPSLTHFEDNIIQSNSTLNIKLYEWLSLKGNIIYNKISLTKRENLLCNIGLAIEKYF